MKSSKKDDQLDGFRNKPADSTLSTDQGVAIPHTDDSLKAGLRGPSLMEDFHLREKITHFDHERIPERVVHARGSGAHGYFQAYKSLSDLTSAGFLCDPARQTPVFVRFSTVVGSRGSADTARDVRGFAVKFYTQEGNFDLVGNNMPVFFIQDGIKFPDLIHAVKPEPHHEMPQAASAHDTFWDFVSLTPETTHMLMWVMSDRALPRSLRMMEGFGVHTFRLVDGKGKSRFCKFHWKPLLGMHSLVWDEAQKISGKDPDFHRRDLWDSIDAGVFPEWELGVQVVEEKDEFAFDFDLLDPTKLIPEELIPVRRVGKLTLNRNPDNFFAETEQVAFHVGNLVPGIDITNDPLLQARLFSYLDTQLTRLGGPNFAEIPINRPIAPVHNHQQDGLHRQTLNTSRAMYHPNSVEKGFPRLASGKPPGFVHFPEHLEGPKTRQRSESFLDHFSQATLFLKSQSVPERQHLVEAFQFELGMVTKKDIRRRLLENLLNVDEAFATEIAQGVGIELNRAGDSKKRPSGKGKNRVESSPALSFENSPKELIHGRCIAVLIGPGFQEADLRAARKALEAEKAKVEVISVNLLPVRTTEGKSVEPDKTFLTAASVTYDGVLIPGGRASIDALLANPDALNFVKEAFQHFKPIGAGKEAVELLGSSDVPADAPGIVVARNAESFAKDFVKAVKKHRFFERATKGKPPGKKSGQNGKPKKASRS